MITDSNNKMPDSVWTRFSQAPRILRAYVIFTISAAIINFAPFYSQALNETLIPYLGWSGLTFYVFSIFFAVSATIVRPQQMKLIYILIVFLALAVLFGAIDTISHIATPSDNFNNPYLAYHQFRPLFTVLLPMIWLLLLISPPVRKWANTPNNNSE